MIPSYQPGVTLDGVDITVDAQNLGGPGGVLAQAGPGPGFLTNQGGFSFLTNFASTSSVGGLTVDVNDFSTPLIVDVLQHEIAHVLGFGTLFNFGLNNLAPVDGQYTGTEGLLAYQAEFDPNGTFIPLHTGNAHFDENTTLTDSLGRVFSNELTTPLVQPTPNSVDPNSNFLSNSTIGVLRDLGFDAIEPVAIPEPSALAIFALGGVTLVRRRRKIA